MSFFWQFFCTKLRFLILMSSARFAKCRVSRLQLLGLHEKSDVDKTLRSPSGTLTIAVLLEEHLSNTTQLDAECAFLPKN